MSTGIFLRGPSLYFIQITHSQSASIPYESQSLSRSSHPRSACSCRTGPICHSTLLHHPSQWFPFSCPIIAELHDGLAAMFVEVWQESFRTCSSRTQWAWWLTYRLLPWLCDKFRHELPRGSCLNLLTHPSSRKIPATGTIDYPAE